MGNATIDRFQAVEGLEVQHMPDGFVVYQSDTDKVHYLNPTAAIVYELSVAGQSKEEIATYLQETFSLETLPLDLVDECIGELLKQELIANCET